MMSRRGVLLVLGSLLFTLPVLAQDPTLDLVMSDPAWIGRTPETAWWDDDSSRIYFRRDRASGVGQETFEIDVATGEQQIVPDAQLGRVPRPGGHRLVDNSRRAWTRTGDVYWRELPAGPIQQLTRTAARERNPLFLDVDRIAFQRGNSWVVRHLSSGLEEEVLVLETGEDPGVEKPEEDLDWLARQQLRLFDVVREKRDDRIAERKLENELSAADATRPPRPWYLGAGVEILTHRLSPRGRHAVVVTAQDGRDIGKRDSMPVWVTESGYVEVEEVRPKVGTSDGTGHSALLLDLENRSQIALDMSGLPGITDRPLAWLADADESSEDEEDAASDDATTPPGENTPREVEIEAVEWSPDGRFVALQVHSIDNKDRWTVLVDTTESTEGAESVNVRTVHHLHDEGWVSWYYNDLGWLPDSSALWLLSEESGWSQLYLVDVASGKTHRLTDGDFVVADPELSPDHTSFVIGGNAEDPRVWDLYRVDLATGERHPLTSLEGGTGTRWPPTGGRIVDGMQSPDGQHLLFAHSSTTRPPELWIARADGSEARALTETVSSEFTSIDWVEPKAVAIPSSEIDGSIHGRFYPARTQDGPYAGAAVLFVHGAGYLQNGHRGWSGYFREFMFHTLLSQHGIAVLDLDYRGSAGYGRDWRTAIYRQMGHPELEDLEDGVRWLTANHGIDPDRVGVYGGSYGGFLTLMSLFREPDLFACGAALRPVTDWAHYNHPYTSNILNTPEEDPKAYRRSSPIEWADGLEKPLLINAPMLDDNVFFQDTVRLSQRLIELGKKGWEVALFPVEPHGFVEPSSWLDEYRRIEELFLQHLRQP